MNKRVIYTVHCHEHHDRTLSAYTFDAILDVAKTLGWARVGNKYFCNVCMAEQAIKQARAIKDELQHIQETEDQEDGTIKKR